MKTKLFWLSLFAAMLHSLTSFGQDATQLEAQYKACSKHFIPADKCTAYIYAQLKAKDEAPPDEKTAASLEAVQEYQSRLKNPQSMQVHRAYFTDDGAICLEIAAQNGFGGMTVSRIVYLTNSWPHRGKNKWLDEEGLGGAMSQQIQRDGGVDRWPGACQKMGAFGRGGAMKPGTDVTEKIKQVLTK